MRNDFASKNGIKIRFAEIKENSGVFKRNTKIKII